MTDKLREDIQEAAHKAMRALIRLTALVRDDDSEEARTFMKDLRAALAEPEEKQEPVAWRFQSAVGGWAYGSQPPVGSKYPVYPLYAAPPRRDWVSLTNEKIVDLWAGVSPINDDDVNIIELGRAIEAALKERNHD